MQGIQMRENKAEIMKSEEMKEEKTRTIQSDYLANLSDSDSGV